MNKSKKKENNTADKRLRCINIDCVFNSSNEPDSERNLCQHPNLKVESKFADITIAICSEFRSKKDYRLEPIDALLMGHGHRLDGPKNRIGVWTWELPAMCPLLPYQTGPRASNSGTVDTGYSVVTTRPDGTMRFNESRSYLVGGS